jgi:hypothetical protein
MSLMNEVNGIHALQGRGMGTALSPPNDLTNKEIPISTYPKCLRYSTLTNQLEPILKINIYLPPIVRSNSIG